MKKGSLRTNGRMRFKANQRGKWWEVAERGVLKNPGKRAPRYES